MKKILSLALISIMAICALSLASCSKDDDKNPSEETKTIVFQYKATSQENNFLEVSNAISGVFQKHIGDLGKVDGSATVKYITISYGSSKDAEVKKIIKEIDPSEFDAAIKKFPSVMYLAFTIHAGNETLQDYTYVLSSDALSGTWAATYDGVNYQMAFTQTKAAQDGYYLATLKIGDKEYPGTYIYVSEVNAYGFNSDEKKKNSKDNCAISVYIYPQGDDMQITIVLEDDNTTLLNDQIFQKVK